MNELEKADSPIKTIPKPEPLTFLEMQIIVDYLLCRKLVVHMN